jgi:uncharacterized protein (TIGR02145 family)
MKTQVAFLMLTLTELFIIAKVNSQTTSYNEQRNMLNPKSVNVNSDFNPLTKKQDLKFNVSEIPKSCSNAFYQKQDSSGNIDLTRGLIAYFPFNGNTNDKSGYNHDAIIFRPMLTDDRFGNDSGTYKFEGETVDGPSCFSTAINPLWNDQLSISFWFKPKENQNIYSDLQGIISFNYEGIIKIYYDHGNLVIELKDQNHQNYIYKNPIELDSDKWYYIYLSCQSNSQVWLKINDTSSDLGAAPNSLLKSVSLLSSAMNYNISLTNTNSLFNGKMDDIRIYNRVLSESEIHALYKEGVEPNPFPTLSIKPVGNISQHSAVNECLITSDGGSPVTSGGFCWDTLPDPDTTNHKIRCDVGTGDFSSTLTNLIPNTTYYVKAYAVNSQGIAFSYQRIFCTLPDKVYGKEWDIEGNTYRTVRIGDQNWMAENLRTSTLNDGSPIYLIDDWCFAVYNMSPAFCWFNYDQETFKFSYGGLYNWLSVNSNKLCPTDWRIPTEEDWNELATSLGGVEVAGGKMKESGISHWLFPNTGATNESGFTALPVSLAECGSAFFPAGSYAAWWSSGGSIWSPTRDRSDLVEWRDNSNRGYPVRCVQQFNTLPNLTTGYVTSVTDTSSICEGSQCADLDSTITSCGVCWSISPSPTINDNKTSDNIETFYFTSHITGLTPNTTYYIRAYVIDAHGVGYGNEHSFKTMTGFTQDIEGNIYWTVTIGSQIWMAENLKTTQYKSGKPIGYITTDTSWTLSDEGAYCLYNNDNKYQDGYGYLYNWYTVSTGDLCPSGWHIPSNDEWYTISFNLNWDGWDFVGGKMKETGTAHWFPLNAGATNESGFTALSGGQRNANGTFQGINTNCEMWVSTPLGSYVCSRSLFVNSADLNGGCGSTKEGYSVRCLKDVQKSTPVVYTAEISNLTATTANAGVIISYDGGEKVALRGLCWDTSSNPDTTKHRYNDRTGTKSFSIKISDLTPETKYYAKAFAVNKLGISYGNEISFVTSKDTDYIVDLKKGLIAYYPFNGNANDESGYNHNGVVDGATLTTDRLGNSDKAYYFNGQGNSITAGGFHIPSDSTTISCWVKVMNGVGIQNFISKHNDNRDVEIIVRSIDNKYAIEWTIGGTFFRLKDEAGQYIIDSNNPKFDFLTLVYNGNKADFYINARFIVSQNITGKIASNVQPLTFGKWAGTPAAECFNGILDEVRIYNRALNGSEIQALYNENAQNGSILIHTPEISAIRNSDFQVPINADNIKPGYHAIAYQFDFTYDPQKIQYQDYSIEGTLSSNGAIQVNPSENKLSIAWAGQTALVDSGVLVKLRFKALECGTVTPVISNFLINTDTVKNITNDTITISHEYGDVDGNGAIQAFDAALTLQYSVGLDPLPDIDPLPWENWRTIAANVDRQDAISAYDASLILQYTVGLINSFPVQSQLKSTGVPLADVFVNVENGYLVFRSSGELFGLNLSVEGNTEVLGTPQVMDANTLLATNISSSVYSVGLASVNAPAENKIIMKIPLTGALVQPVILNMTINYRKEKVVLGMPDGLSEPLNKSIEMYPNPANMMLYFRNLVGETSISIFDLQGRKVMTGIITNNQVDIGNLDHGLYTIRIEDSKNIIIGKLIKQ